MASIGLWTLALVLGYFVWQKHGREQLTDSLKQAGWRSLSLLPRIFAAVLTAGFVGELLPREFIAHHIGPDSGFSGVLLASAVGSVIPGGPIISFPLVVTLQNSGAGLVQLVAFLTAWSCFALHRVLTFEMPLMGPKFSGRRLISSLPLPFIAAGIMAISLSILGQ